jgi:dimethylaniline monooxygenase (N-oxide forming)
MYQGISGLTALKECLANGIDATVFESRSDIGGQWNYEEHPQPLPRLNAESCSNTQSIRLSQHSAFTTNMHEGVVLNSCRDTTHFSDFPMSPDRYPEFFGHRLFKQYIDEYTDYYGLRGYIRVNTPVLLCKVLESGQWCVTYRTAEGATANEQYDAVFACSGRVSTPLLPEFPGRERFKGEFMHSHVYRRPGRFEGKKVAVIGFGNSAADVSCEVAPQAKELHLITRRGGWVVPRYAFGKPAEAFNSKIWLPSDAIQSANERITGRMAESVLPTKISEWGQTALLNLVMGDLPKDIQPEHTVHEANVTVRGDLLENIRVGRITVHRAEVGKMTETGLKLSNDKTLDVDVIICCTGYRINFPYLALDDVDPSGGFLELYKHIVPPRFSNLFLIGLIELPGPALPVIEAQTRWATAVVTKRITLPSQPKMDEWIEAYRQNRAAKVSLVRPPSGSLF